MDTLNVLTCYLLKRAGNHSLGEDVTQNIRIIDILCALPDTEYGDLLRQVRVGEQRIAAAIGRDRLAETRVRFLRRRAILIIMIDNRAPGDHIDRIVVEQFHLRCELGDVVPRTGACGQQFGRTASEAGQHRLCSAAVRVADLIAFIQYKAGLSAMDLQPFFDLPVVLAQRVEGHQDKIAGLDPIQIPQPFHEHIGYIIIGQHHIPVIADGDGR